MSEQQFRQRAMSIFGESSIDACLAWPIEALLTKLRKSQNPKAAGLRRIFLQSYGQ